MPEAETSQFHAEHLTRRDRLIVAAVLRELASHWRAISRQFHAVYLTRRDRLIVAAVLRELASQCKAAASYRDMTPERMEEIADSLELDYDGDDVELAERCAATIGDDA